MKKRIPKHRQIDWAQQARDLKLQLIMLKVQRLEFEAGIASGDFVPTADLTAWKKECQKEMESFLNKRLEELASEGLSGEQICDRIFPEIDRLQAKLLARFKKKTE